MRNPFPGASQRLTGDTRELERFRLRASAEPMESSSDPIAPGLSACDVYALQEVG